MNEDKIRARVAQEAIGWLQERNKSWAIELDDHLAEVFGKPTRELLDRADALASGVVQVTTLTEADYAKDRAIRHGHPTGAYCEECVDEDEAYGVWLKTRPKINGAHNQSAALTSRPAPVAPLPTIPGFYVGDYDQSPSGKILIELLNRPAGQWVDNTDSRYLEDEWVRGLGNLTRLVPVGSES